MTNNIIGNFKHSTPTPAPTVFQRPVPNQIKPLEAPGYYYGSNNINDVLRRRMMNDLNAGTLRPEVQQLIEAVLFHGKQGLPKVEVSRLPAGKIASSDALVIERVPAEPKKPNAVLFIPHSQQPSFQSFKSVAEMNTWLKKQVADPAGQPRFAQHTSEPPALGRRKRETDREEYPAKTVEIPSTPAEVIDITPPPATVGKPNAAVGSEQIDQAGQTLVDLADMMTEQYPTAEKVVAEQVRKDIKAYTKKFGPSEIDIDPDKVFIQHFSEDDPDYKKHGFTPKGFVIGDHKPTSAPKSLTQAIADNDPWLDDRVSGGQTVIFSGAPANPTYDPDKKVDIDPGLLPSIARNRDMAKLYGDAQRAFWQKNMGNMQALHEKNYMLRAGIQGADGTLSKDGLAMVVEAAEFETPGKADSKHVERSLLDIGGYRSTDIVVLKHKENGRAVVYIPGDGQSFYEFPNVDAMRQWVFDLAKTEQGRASLEIHFTDYYLRDGASKDGVSSILKHIGEKTKRYLNSVVGYGRAESRIEGNLLENLTKVQAWDAISDGDERIKSNRKILLARIANLAGAVGTLIPPAVFLTAPTQIMIGAWQANNGHSAAERSGGLAHIGSAVGDLALSVLPTSWAGKLLKSVVKRGSRLIKGFGRGKGSYTFGRRAPKTDVPVGTEGAYKPKPEQPKISAPPITKATPGVREIEVDGAKYFVASKPDAGDGVHYLLRVQDPKNPAQLVNSGKVAKPGEGGVWHRSGTGTTMTQMRGPMTEMNVLGGEIHTFTDVYKKGGTRLNVVVHGVERSAADVAAGLPSKVVIDGKAYNATQLIELLKKRGIDPADSRYESIRLLICYAADGGGKSFAREFQKAVGKPVKAFEGTVTMSHGATNMEYVRSVFEADIRALHPDLDENAIELLVTAEVEKFIHGKPIRVNKDDGTLVQTQSAPQGATIGNQIIRIEYKPVHFTGGSSSPTNATS